MLTFHKLFILLVCWNIGLSIGYKNAEFRGMKRLFEHLLEGGRYNKLVVPKENHNTPLKVTFNLDIKRLVALDTFTQVMSLDAVISMMWFDNQLKWNPNHFSNITMIRLPSDIVWQPDIILYNSADQFKGLPSGDILMVIMYNGYVVYSPLVKTNSFCNVPNKHPKQGDIVTCILKFGSWAYDGLAIEVVPAGMFDDTSTEYDVDMPSMDSEFNREWEIMSITVKRNVIYYACCPEPYVDITYRLMIKYK